MPGLAIAEVVSTDDSTGEGRLQLRFPDLPGAPQGVMAPIASSLAGSGRGAFLMPEVGEEVLVGFHHGQFEFPFVIGYLWSGPERPPETDAQNRVFVTRTGHALRFEDGNNKVILKSGGGRTITLDDNAGTITIETGGTTLIMDGTTITASCGSASITMDPTSIVLSGGGRQVALAGGAVAIT